MRSTLISPHGAATASAVMSAQLSAGCDVPKDLQLLRPGDNPTSSIRSLCKDSIVSGLIALLRKVDTNCMKSL
jgi:hypothetical protein